MTIDDLAKELESFRSEFVTKASTASYRLQDIDNTLLEWDDYVGKMLEDVLSAHTTRKDANKEIFRRLEREVLGEGPVVNSISDEHLPRMFSKPAMNAPNPPPPLPVENWMDSVVREFQNGRAA